MKAKNLITAILLLAAGVSFAQESIFDRFSGQKDITCITITKALINMLPSASSSINMNGIDIKGIADKLEQVDIFTSKTKNVVEQMEAEATQYFSSNKSYEMLMKIKNEADNVTFYGQKAENAFKSLVILVSNNGECVLVHLSGKLTVEDIRTATATMQGGRIIER
ncbi:MAG: DUF4252 domain-containing protein [Prevotellaceae bacterium]|nr:DUF4252 domain-containing protein [Prevotellaceae bacterium]